MYRGDYYRGDPGFFSAIGGLVKKAVGFIPGVGPIASGALGMIGGGATKVAGGGGKMAVMKGAIGKIGGAIKKHPVLSAAGAAGAMAGVGALTERALTGGGRKRRRMNVYNPRALRRAVRRAHGFAKMARRVLHIEKRFKNPKRWGHMGHFPKKRKRRA